MYRTEKIESWGIYHDTYRIVRGAYRFSPTIVKGANRIVGLSKIVAAFRGMHVSPAKHSFGKCDRKVWHSDRRTKWSLCVAMLRRQHKNIVCCRKFCLLSCQFTKCNFHFVFEKVPQINTSLWSMLDVPTTDLKRQFLQLQTMNTHFYTRILQNISDNATLHFEFIICRRRWQPSCMHQSYSIWLLQKQRWGFYLPKLIRYPTSLLPVLCLLFFFHLFAIGQISTDCLFFGSWQRESNFEDAKHNNHNMKTED